MCRSTLYEVLWEMAGQMAERESGGMVGRKTQDYPGNTRCAEPCEKRKYFNLVVVGALVVLVVCVVCLWPSQDVSTLLASAGLARLPESAEDVIVERQGGSLEWQFIFVRFTATTDDIARFVDESAVTSVDAPTSLLLAKFRVKGITDPQWWPQRPGTNHQVYGVTSKGPLSGITVNSKRFYGALVVDGNTIYLRFMGPSRLYKLRRRLPF